MLVMQSAMLLSGIWASRLVCVGQKALFGRCWRARSGRIAFVRCSVSVRVYYMNVDSKTSLPAFLHVCECRFVCGSDTTLMLGDLLQLH